MKRLSSGTLALLLAVLVVSPILMQTVAAIACGGACIAAGVGIAAGTIGGYAASEFLDGDDVDDVYAESEAAQTHVNVYTHADTIRDDEDMFRTMWDNDLKDGSREMAFAKAKYAYLQAYNNDSNSPSEVRSIGKNASADYYAVTETNMVNTLGSHMQKTHHLAKVIDAHSELSASGEGPYIDATGHADEYTIVGLGETEYTLVNGSTVTAKVLLFEQSDYTYATGPYPTSNINESNITVVNSISSADVTSVDGYNQYYDGGTSNYWHTVDMSGYSYDLNGNGTIESNESASDFTVVPQKKWVNRFNQLDDAHSEIKNNVDLYADSIESEYTQGEAPTDQLIDPTTLTLNSVQNYEETGQAVYAGSHLMAGGVPANINMSMTIETANGTVLNGYLLTEWRSGQSWTVGQSYDPTNASELVYFASQEEGLALLNSSFTVTDIRHAETGESKENVTLDSYNRQTTSINNSELKELFDLYMEMEERKQTAKGGGSAPLDDVSTKQLIGGAGVLIGVAFLLKQFEN